MDDESRKGIKPDSARQDPSSRPPDTPSDKASDLQPDKANQAEAQKPAPAKDQTPEKPAEKKTTRRRWWLWAGLAVVALLGFFVVRRLVDSHETASNKKNTKQSGAAITTGQSRTGDINIYVDALGTVTPVYTVTLYSQITGRVMSVHYTEGQMVREGDPLIDIDPRPYQATLTAAEGTLEHDLGVLAEARMDLQRYKAAYEKNAIAKQQLDDQEQTVFQDEGTVKADQGNVDYDRVQLAYCHIVSPITGRVGLRLVDPGNTVFSGNGSTLVVITQLQPITVVFNVSEDDLTEIQSQLSGGRTLSVDAYDRANEKKIETGKLTSLDNQVDTTTGTVKFRAEFPNKNLALFPNQFVNARLLVRTLRKVTLVPTAAVQHNGTNAFVYIVNPDNKVSVQQVTTQTSNDQDTAVQGLNGGVNVATSGFDRLENGVEVVTRGQPGTTAAPGHGATSGTTSGTGGTAP
jgi:multidrug efflux system membrane fusion protein